MNSRMILQYAGESPYKSRGFLRLWVVSSRSASQDPSIRSTEKGNCSTPGHIHLVVVVVVVVEVVVGASWVVKIVYSLVKLPKQNPSLWHVHVLPPIYPWGKTLVFLLVVPPWFRSWCCHLHVKISGNVGHRWYSTRKSTIVVKPMHSQFLQRDPKPPPKSKTVGCLCWVYYIDHNHCWCPLYYHGSYNPWLYSAYHPVISLFWINVWSTVSIHGHWYTYIPCTSPWTSPWAPLWISIPSSYDSNIM